MKDDLGYPSSSHRIIAGGVPSDVCGGTIKRPSPMQGGINGGGKGPSVSQKKPGASYIPKTTRMKVARQHRADRLRSS